MRPPADHDPHDAPPERRGRIAAWLCTLLIATYALVALVPAGPAQRVRLFQAAYLLASAGWIGWMVLLSAPRVRLPSLRSIVLVAVLLRLALLAAEPNDDVYRYVWEGRVRLAGLNPYVYAPDDPRLARLRDAMWSRINHPNHAAIYPPLAQGTFVALAAIDPSVRAVRIAIVVADLLTVLVLTAWLRRRGDDPRRVAVYALAPLVLWSFAHEAHYDALMLLSLGVLLWRCDARRPPASRDLLAGGAALGAAIALKWVAAVLLPWWVVRAATGCERSRRAWIVRGLAVGLPVGVVLLAALPYLDHGWAPLLGPLRYFARAFHVLDWPRQQLLRFASASTVTIASAVIVGGVAVALALRRVAGATAVTWSFTPVLALSPTLHPWYVTWPLVGIVARPAWTVVALAVGVVVAGQARYLQLTTGTWQMPHWAAQTVWWPVLATFLLELTLRTVRRVAAARAGRRALRARAEQ